MSYLITAAGPDRRNRSRQLAIDVQTFEELVCVIVDERYAFGRTASEDLFRQTHGSVIQRRTKFPGCFVGIIRVKAFRPLNISFSIIGTRKKTTHT